MSDSVNKGASGHKILLLDDDPEVLSLYQQMLLQLPSQPEVHIATTAVSGLTLLESQPFTLLVSDLKMPKMDGLQVLALVRRKFPHLRTVVLTGLVDEQLRSRAYAMGVDLFFQKPSNKKELTFLLECIESLLDQEESGGFRGVQSKSLVDLIQLECLSGNSAVLRITNGRLEGRVWVQNGELIDAATEGIEGEDAFKKILGWKGGNFEVLPADPDRPRKIKTSYQGLLLDTAQSLDEAQANPAAPAEAEVADSALPEASTPLGRIPGIEFALRYPEGIPGKVEHWGSVEDPEKIASWVKNTVKSFDQMGRDLNFGLVESLVASGLQRHVQVLPGHGSRQLVVGMVGSLSRSEMEETMNKVVEVWGS